MAVVMTRRLPMTRTAAKLLRPIRWVARSALVMTLQVSARR